jgi:hypothetical protein
MDVNTVSYIDVDAGTGSIYVQGLKVNIRRGKSFGMNTCIIFHAILS